MRRAVQSALLADAAIAALVGTRVYVREGIEGGISRVVTPEAWDADGNLLPSIVVTLESARRDTSRGGAPDQPINTVQTIALWCYQQTGYGVIRQLVRAAKRVLHRRPLTPMDDTVRWLDTNWSDDTHELVDADLGAPLMTSRYDAVVVDPLT